MNYDKLAVSLIKYRSVDGRKRLNFEVNKIHSLENCGINSKQPLQVIIHALESTTNKVNH